MIHDVLISLMTPSSDNLPIESFLISDGISTFLHPGEKQLLEEIVQLIKELRKIIKFTEEYEVNSKCSTSNNIEEPQPDGLYIQAFATAIKQVLKEYYTSIAALEKEYLKNPTSTLMYIFFKVNDFRPLFHFINRIISNVRFQRLHGCAIMQYIHQNTFHGKEQISLAMETIQSTVNAVFIKQLTHWILYGKIVDNYGEFFIQCSENRNYSTQSENCISERSGKFTNPTISETASSYADIWRYEICFDFLPNYLSSNWAEKVLFIGQTVLMFKVDKDKSNRKGKIWTDFENLQNESLWNEKEHIFFRKMQQLQLGGDVNVAQYERVIDEIKHHVTERLSQIAIDQADLIKQLKLIKDIFLLGRGELFLEFIKNTYMIGKSVINENKARTIIKAFETATHGVNIFDDLEQFVLTIPKDQEKTNDFETFGYLQHLSLHYKINWPLHLLFSPRVIERYNELFRFLLLIRKMQYELHMVWFKSRRQRKGIDANVLQLRNQLMFLLDNLQYYIQVDVLDSQFSILMNVVQDSTDFENIQRAHSVFQANILSLCFLWTKEDLCKSNIVQNEENPVHSILTQIFFVCESFCSLMESAQLPMSEKELKDCYALDQNLTELMQKLMNLLLALKTGPTGAPLSQLLLRLDFNYWFSTRSPKN